MVVEQELNRFVTEVQEACDRRLRAVVLHGSAAAGTYVPGRSDLNFLVVCEQVDRAILDKLQQLVQGWRRRRIALPLVVAEDFLGSSTDSYPLEILGMQSAYRLLGGQDPLAGLTIDRANVRLQAERELKAKALLLRGGYMQSAGKADRLLATIGASATAITAVLRGMLYIKDASWKEAGPGFRKACSESLAVDGALLESIWAIRIGKPKHDREATINLYMSVLDLIRDLSRQIDD